LSSDLQTPQHFPAAPTKTANTLAPLSVGAAGLLLLVIAMIRSVDLFSPDAVSYLRVAQYYAQGRFDLAVNGYWGPLLSWLMLLFLSDADRGLGAMRIAMGFSAVLFVAASVRLFFVFHLSRTQIVAAMAATSLCAIFWAVNQITPDLLMSGLFLFGLGVTLLPSSSPRMHFAGGIFYGMAYLAKSVALPLSIVVILVIFGLRLLLRTQPARQTLGAAGLTLCGILAVAVPWIVIISIQHGAPVFSTSGPIAHVLVGPGELDGTHPLFRDFDVPPAERLTSWEDPATLAYDYWSPLENGEMRRHQTEVFLRNILLILAFLRGTDELGLGLAACIAGFLFHQPWRNSFKKEPWRYSLLVLVCVCGIYAPVFANESRYYVLCYPLLLACALAFFGQLARFAGQEGEDRFRFPVILSIALVTASFISPVLPGVWTAVTRGSPTPEFHAARAFSAQLAGAPDGAIASVGENDERHIAFYVSYLADRRYHGTRMGLAPAADILGSGATYVLVGAGSPTDLDLAADNRFAAFPVLDGLAAEYRLYRVNGG